MNPRVLYHIARADFFERVRRYSFLVTLAFTLYAGYEVNRGNIVINVGRYRGVYNSAWLGLLLSMTATTLISLVGFYVIKNTVERDRQTGVGQILAATPLSRISYLFGKALSNFAVVSVIMVLLLLAAFAMQFWRAESAGVDLWQLFAPFLILTAPALAFLAALAVLFECVPGLRGGFGNVFYFFFWTALLGAGFGWRRSSLDMLGFSILQRDVVERAKSILPEYQGGFSFQIGPHSGQTFLTFVWDGFHWTAFDLAQRAACVGIAALTVLLAAAFFDRFDTSRGFLHRFSGGLHRTAVSAAEAVVPAGAAEGAARLPSLPIPEPAHLSPLPESPQPLCFPAILRAELRLMLKGRSRWWYLVALGLLIGSFAAPAGEPRGKVLAFAWLWPVLVWSAMGTREARFATGPLVFSSARALQRQLPAVWLAGTAVAALAGAGVGARALLARDWAHLAAWTVGALFIPALALALGVWSGTSKLFEGLYTALWYAGPAQPTPGLDFMGASSVVHYDAPLYYLAATVGLLVLAAAGRRRQIRT